MNYKKFLFNFALGIVLLALNLVSFNYLLSGGFLRWDLTEDKEYTISEATKRIVGNLTDQLVIRGYFSKDLPTTWATIPGKIKDLCQEYRAYSKGMIKVEFLDPGEDIGARADAMDQYGIQEHTFKDQSRREYALKKCYFSLLILYGDRHKMLPLNALLNIPALEYELTSALKNVVFGFQNVEALFSKMTGRMIVRGYLSKENLPENVEKVPAHLETVCKEFQEKAGGKFGYEIVDPKEDKNLQQEIYKKFGVRPVYTTFPPDPKKMVYLSAVIEFEGKALPLNLSREELSPFHLRQSIEGVIKRMVPGFLKTVGVVTPDPDIPPEMMMRMQQPPKGEFSSLNKILEQEYTVRKVPLKGGAGVPEDIDVLLVARPKALTEVEKYAIDQYVMQGRPLILCVDTAEVQQVPADPRNPYSQARVDLAKVDTGLDDLLNHWGIQVKPEIVLDANCLSTTQTERDPKDPRIFRLRHYELPYALNLQKGSFNKDHLIVSEIEGLAFLLASPVEIDKEKGKDVITANLIQSSEKSWTNTNFQSVLATPGEKVTPPEKTARQTLAIALRGKFKSFYYGKEIPAPAAVQPPMETRTPPPTLPPGMRPPPPFSEVKKKAEMAERREKARKMREEAEKSAKEKKEMPQPPQEKKEEETSGEKSPPTAALSPLAVPGILNALFAATVPSPIQAEDPKAATPAGESEKKSQNNLAVENTQEPGPEGQKQYTLEASPETRIIVVGDADFVSDGSLGFGSNNRAALNAQFLFNMIDWAMLDSDMISIRSRGSTNRAIDELESGKKKLIEYLNYAIPIGLVILLGIIRLILRKRKSFETVVAAAWSIDEDGSER